MQNPIAETRNAWKALHPLRGKLAFVASCYIYAAAEFIPVCREGAGVVFNHIGNTTVSYQAALLGAYGVARAVYGLKPDINNKTADAISAVCGAAAGLAVDTISEIPTITEMFNVTAPVSDPKDLLFGIAGAVLGAYAVSFDRIQEQQTMPQTQTSE